MSVSTQHTEQWMDQIFSAVQLPQVKSEEIHNTAERESVLAELDQVLQRERSLSGSTKSSHQSSHHEEPHVYDPVASDHENHYETIPEAQPQSARSDSLAEEEADVFPTDGAAIQADIASLRHLQIRSRAHTLESQLSAAESRFGSFDVQTDEGRYKGSQIDLYHNEVAYLRPKKTHRKGTSESTPLATPRQSIHSVERQESKRNSIPKLPQNGVTQPSVPKQNGGPKLGKVIHLEEPIPFNDTVVEQIESGMLLKEINGYGIIRPSFNDFVHEKFRHYVVGNRGSVDEEEKIVLLVGESGSGKSTFIYSALNYLYGVEREYDFRFAIESPNEIQPTSKTVTMYTFRNTIIGQTITLIDTPGIEKESTLELIRGWIKYRLTKRPKLTIDGLVTFAKHGDHHKQNPILAAKYSQLEQLLGGDIRTLTIPACTFAYYAGEAGNKSFANLPFPVDHHLVFNNVGYLPGVQNLQQLVNYKTSCSSFDELFLTLNYKLHPVVLLSRNSP